MKTSEKNNHKKMIVVCGATGTQGSAVLEKMLAFRDIWHIVALTRDENGEKTNTLRAKGIEIRRADLEDKTSLIHAFEGAYGVFGVTQPWSTDNKHCFPEKEIQQGKNIVDACAENNVSHLVYSSVLNFTSRPIQIPHVDSKLIIEAYIKSKNLNYTILRFPQFMDNIGSSFFPVKKGVIKGFVDADAKVPYIYAKDIGKFVRNAFLHYDNYQGREISIIGDIVSGFELGEIFQSIRKGQKFKYKSVPRILMRIFAKEFYTMRVFFETYGRKPFLDIPEKVLVETKTIQPDITSMRDFLLLENFDSKTLS
ncbi:MAG: NmrA/HSCARG family protein [Cyclobacteriaceae bacterium]|nr:NmrA/HSCARG family protein [Cyclobacteriaceae bacterium]